MSLGALTAKAKAMQQQVNGFCTQVKRAWKLELQALFLCTSGKAVDLVPMLATQNLCFTLGGAQDRAWLAAQCQFYLSSQFLSAVPLDV